MLQAQIDAQKERIFRDFIGADGVVFIVDKNPSSRRRLAQVIADMGVKANNVHRYSEIAEAEKTLTVLTPKIVISDFNVGKYSGLDLFQRVREADKNSFSSIFVIVTSNITQSAVAKAAEEDVDSYIIKPFTVQGIKACLYDAVAEKVQPSEYVKTIEAGKELLLAGKFKESLDYFTKALKLHAKPTLAHFYYGQAESFLNNDQDAAGSYTQGLKYNKIHFKCQIGLFDLYMKEKKFLEAFQIIKTLSEYFPPNAERLATAIRLAVVTQNLLDIQRFYELFQDLDNRTPEAIKYVSAGMFVLAKHYLATKNVQEALNTFDRLTTSCAGDPKFIYSVIETLGENELYHEINKHFQKIPTTVLGSEQIDVCRYLMAASSPNYPQLMSMGINLFNKGIRSYLVMRIFINSLTQCGYPDKALEFIGQARVMIPNKQNAWARLEYDAKRMVKHMATLTPPAQNPVKPTKSGSAA